MSVTVCNFMLNESSFLFGIFLLQSALDLFIEMEKNELLSNSRLDILRDTLQEMDQELVSILNRYKPGMKPLPTRSNYTATFSSLMMSPPAFQWWDRDRDITRFVRYKMSVFVAFCQTKFWFFILPAEVLTQPSISTYFTWVLPSTQL